MKFREAVLSCSSQFHKTGIAERIAEEIAEKGIKRVKLVGDAGTGKTTTIVLLSSMTGFQILSHTNAAIEACNNAAKNKELTVNTMTIHSLGARHVRELLRNTTRAGGIEKVRKVFAKKIGIDAEKFFSIYSYAVNVYYPREIPKDDPKIGGLARFIEKYEEFKRRNGYIDYEDMLKVLHSMLENGLTLSGIIVDEAQDLSPLQFSIVSRAEQCVLTGDDLQSIFSFQGAKVELFRDYPGKIVVLKKNFRIPSNIWSFAGKIVSDQLKRARAEAVIEGGEVIVEKPKTPREIAKDVAREMQKSGDVIVLARFNATALILRTVLRLLGVPVVTQRKEKGAVLVDTIHACKGYEAKTVFLLDAIAPTALDEPLEVDEEERRVWYVGMTRAREKLIVQPLVGVPSFLSSQAF